MIIIKIEYTIDYPKTKQTNYIQIENYLKFLTEIEIKNFFLKYFNSRYPEDINIKINYLYDVNSIYNSIKETHPNHCIFSNLGEFIDPGDFLNYKNKMSIYRSNYTNNLPLDQNFLLCTNEKFWEQIILEWDEFEKFNRIDNEIYLCFKNNFKNILNEVKIKSLLE